MTKDHASLQRQPFLTPIWLTVLGAVVVASIFAGAVWFWATADSTTIIVVRHAEESVDTGGGTQLSPAGETHAELLSRMFGDGRAAGRIDAVYVSPAARDRLTVARLSTTLGIAPVIDSTGDPRELARRVIREHSGGRILVVARDGTMGDIVAALSGGKPRPSVGEAEYGAMYIVSVSRIGRPNVLHLTY
jgi:broad specificity phosphatase PhoE